MCRLLKLNDDDDDVEVARLALKSNRMPSKTARFIAISYFQ